MIQATPIRADLTGSDQCRAEGSTVRATSPILEMCRHLIAVGHDPGRPLHCYRDDVLALKVNDIGVGARLRVRGDGVGFGITGPATRPTAPPVRASALAGAAMTVAAADPTALSAPDTKAGRLQRACLDLLREHERKGDIPTNGHFVFYELEQRGVTPKNYDGVNPKTGQKWARTPLQDVSDALMRLRELGLIPWAWTEDETRSLDSWRYAEAPHHQGRAARPRSTRRGQR